MNILVVPTIRENCIKPFLGLWQHKFDEVVVIEDNPTKTFALDIPHHYSWKEIKDEWGDDSWIISKRDSAIRAWGFWKAYKLNAKIIFTLDDDCLPDDDCFVNLHLNNLYQTPKWTNLIPGLRTRGLPYRNFGNLDVVANVGLWTGVPDFDGANQLINPINNFYPPVENRVIPHGEYFPFTGMNFCFKREVAILSYFPLMGDGQPYNRFDDIWFGIIFKKVCDHLNYYITAGRPFVKHEKASDPFVNLIKEAPGIKMNETFWEYIEKINLKSQQPHECMLEICTALYQEKDPYLKKLGQAISIWAQRFYIP